MKNLKREQCEERECEPCESSELAKVISVLSEGKSKYEYVKNNVIREYHNALNFVENHNCAVKDYKENSQYKEPQTRAEYYFEAQGMLKALEKIKNCL